MSVEQRKKLANRVKELAEEARVAIRNIRRDANKQSDVEQTDKVLTEDDVATCKDEVQTLTKKFETRVNEIADRKSAPRSWSLTWLSLPDRWPVIHL